MAAARPQIDEAELIDGSCTAQFGIGTTSWELDRYRPKVREGGEKEDEKPADKAGEGDDTARDADVRQAVTVEGGTNVKSGREGS